MPLPSGLVVKKGMKMWEATSSGISPALLLTSMMMASCSVGKGKQEVYIWRYS